MITKLLLTLSLLYGSIVHSQNNKELEGLEEFLSSWKNFVSIGDKNPKFLTKITSNCLLSVDIETDICR